MTASKVAVVLSGCGYLDGAEIRESVLTLLYLDQHGADVSIFAPDILQAHVVNHLVGEEEGGQQRNVLAESARIARGKIAPLGDLNVDAFDALVIPGGFGVAKNLSDFAFKGADSQPHSLFAEKIQTFFRQQKPIGAICIAPAIVALALKDKGLTLTVGDDADVAGVIASFGHTHQPCVSEQAVLDEANKIATCSAYMREDSLAKIARGIERVVESVLKWSTK